METKSYKVCCFFTRKFKAIDGDVASYVMEVFESYTDGGIHMNVNQLRRFIEESRGDVVSIADAERILDQILLKRHRVTNRKTLSYEDFHNYVLSDQLNPPIKSQVHQDMNLPMSRYFIYTSHNSYLTGNQLSSDCSDVPIINALKRGVRVIKLDLWPNSSKDNVHVLHGGTLTTPVELIRCLNSIKEHAFTTSPYPVIIILEDHLTPGLQAKVAQMVTDTFGEMLFCHKLSKLKELPSPESLKHRILVSAEDEYESDESDNDHDTEDYDIKISDSCTAYKNLIAIYAAKPKGVVEALKIEKDELKHLSLSEQEFKEAVKHHQQEIVRFTHKNILRMYLKHTRITSSNYNPLVGWLHGAQMIAFNMQGYGRWLWLMHGMFQANGGCGYVQKPDFLMTSGPNNEVFNPKTELPVKKTLKVKIYMGDGWNLDFKKTHFSAFSPPDFYTKISIYGAPTDEIMKMTRVKENTWAPIWNEEFEFSFMLPEIALLLIEVIEYNKTEKNDFAGQTCLPVSELMPGIHVVPLCNRKGDPYTGAKLLMRFQFVSNEF